MNAALAVLGIVQIVKLRADLRIALDFFDYWLDARVGIVFGWSRIYDPGAVQLLTASEGVSRHIATDQVPWLILFCAPFALLPYPLAEAAWTALLVAAMVLAWLLAAPAAGRAKLSLGLAGLVAPPVALGLAFGQAAILVAASLAAGCHLLRRQRPLAAGLVLGGLLLKPHIVLLVPLVLLAVRPRAFLALAGVGAVGAAGALLVLGPQGGLAYFEYLRGVHGGDAQFLVPADLTLGGGGGPLPTLARLGILGLAGLVVARNRRGKVEIPLTAAVLASLLVTPFEHTYDSLLLVVAAWMHLAVRAGRADRWVLLLALAVSFVEPFASGLMSVVMCLWLGLLALETSDGEVRFPALRRPPAPEPTAVET